MRTQLFPVGFAVLMLLVACSSSPEPSGQITQDLSVSSTTSIPSPIPSPTLEPTATSKLPPTTTISPGNPTPVLVEKNWGDLSAVTPEEWKQEGFGSVRYIPNELASLPDDYPREKAIALWRDYVSNGAVVWGGVIGINKRVILCADGTIAVPPGSDEPGEYPGETWDLELGEEGVRHIYLTTKEGFTRLPLVDARIDDGHLMAINSENTWYQEVVITEDSGWDSLCNTFAAMLGGTQ